MKDNVTTPAIASPVASPSLINPPAFFAHKDRVARWSLIGVAMLGTSQILTLLLLFQVVIRPPWIASSGSGGPGWIGGYGKTLQEAKQVQVELAVLTAQALLQRTQGDFDLPELLEALFSRTAQQAAATLKAAEAQEFRDKGLSQKVHVARIEALETRPDKVRLAVTGNLERRGQMQQYPLSEPLRFKLILDCRLNPDALSRERHPLLVTEFQLDYENIP